MKRILMLFLLLVPLVVQGDAYSVFQLIPVNTKATITTESFIYEDFYYSRNPEVSGDHIVFTKLKNRLDKERPITITIALFDSEKKNIGTIHYCSKKEGYEQEITKIKSQEAITYTFTVFKKYVTEEKKTNDVMYISVLGENNKCKTSGTLDYVGKTIGEIKEINANHPLDKFTSNYLYIGLGLFGLFLLFVFGRLILGPIRNRKQIMLEQQKKEVEEPKKEEVIEELPPKVEKEPEPPKPEVKEEEPSDLRKLY